MQKADLILNARFTAVVTVSEKVLMGNGASCWAKNMGSLSRCSLEIISCQKNKIISSFT